MTIQAQDTPVPGSREHDAEPFITLDDVAIRLYGRVLFEHTHWELHSDQQWAVVGPNGSGKSTLMRALCGQVPIVAGRIVYHFAENCTLPQRHVAYVSFEGQKAFVPFMNPFHQARWNSARSREGPLVREFLSAEHVHRVNPFQVVDPAPDPDAFAARQAKVVDLLQIEPLLERHVVQLSSGERRKVTIARALLRGPRLLILDNPFTGLDARFRARLGDAIEQLAQGDTRVVLAATDLDQVGPAITHVLEVDGCRVVAAVPRGQAGARGGPSLMPDDARAPISSSCEGELEGRCDVSAAAGRLVEDSEPLALLQLRDVHVAYDGVTVLDGVDWTVREGEHWALLGPNGAGKTTLLSLVLGDNPQAYANDVTLFGRRRGSGESIWEIKRWIGWVSPELHLHYRGGCSCLDVVCSGFFDSVGGLYRRCTARQQKTARRWMERMGIAGQASERFAGLSEGEQRLALVARAMVKEPRLLVLDEPCQGLDAENRGRVNRAIDEAGSRPGTSVIVVTHREDTLPGVVDRVLRLDGGKVITTETRRKKKDTLAWRRKYHG